MSILVCHAIPTGALNYQTYLVRLLKYSFSADAKCWGGVKTEYIKMSGGENDKFEEEKFMKILVNLKDTQESIQGFSGWCIKNRKAAYKMARCWIKVIKKVNLSSEYF